MIKSALNIPIYSILDIKYIKQSFSRGSIMVCQQSYEKPNERTLGSGLSNRFSGAKPTKTSKKCSFQYEDAIFDN